MRTGRDPAAQRRWEAWLFEPHSRAELAVWAPSLGFFRFCRAIGGHSGDDADVLEVAVRVKTPGDLERIAGGLDLRLVALPDDEPEPVPGQAYDGEAYRRFQTRVPGTGVKQPGHVEVAGVPAFAWVTNGRLTLTPHDAEAPWQVTDRSIAAARQIEPLLRPLAADLVDPPRNSEHCICPQFYPELWGLPGADRGGWTSRWRRRR